MSSDKVVEESVKKICDIINKPIIIIVDPDRRKIKHLLEMRDMHVNFVRKLERIHNKLRDKEGLPPLEPYKFRWEKNNNTDFDTDSEED